MSSFLTSNLPGLQESEYASLLAIYEHFESDVLILNEIISIVKQIGYANAYKFMQESQTVQKIILDQLAEEEIKQKRVLTLSRTDPQVSKVLGKCTNCGSQALSAVQIQTRSADEAATTFVSCANCGTMRKK